MADEKLPLRGIAIFHVLANLFLGPRFHVYRIVPLADPPSRQLISLFVLELAALELLPFQLILFTVGAWPELPIHVEELVFVHHVQRFVVSFFHVPMLSRKDLSNSVKVLVLRSRRSVELMG